MTLHVSNLLLIFFIIYYFNGVEAQTDNATITDDQEGRSGKFFPIFQLVKFQNDVCKGASSRNGTCYTNEECKTRGGIASGSCAAGFGVCCIFALGCGSTSSENCTYLTQTSTMTNTISPCSYKICKCDSNVCRIRLDFHTFQIGDQTVGTAVAIGTEAISTNGDSIGECGLDQFTLTSPGSFAPPVICGYNSGQHMIVDASDECHVARFTLSGSATRSWDIKVTQYKCGDIGRGGDNGCLQYFTGESGSFASYGFPTSANALLPTTTHLQSQCYSMCWRVEEGFCGICFSPMISSSPTNDVISSFGVGNPTGGAVRGEKDKKCATDYLLIPQAQSISTEDADTFVVTTDISTDTGLRTRVCGRFFNIGEDGRLAPATICTQSRPFRMAFKTDDSEMITRGMPAKRNEQSGLPGGIVGFYLEWEQQKCA